MKRNIFYISSILFLFFQTVHLGAQDKAPWNYNTPLDKRIYGKASSTLKEVSINPAEWGSAASGYDGLTITATLTNPWIADKNKLLTFYDRSNFKYMEIFSDSQTLNIRRYHPNFPNQYYDYLLLDKMFDRPGDWDVRFYVTGFFLWIQAKIPNTNQYYLTPVYFGLDYPDLSKNNLNDLIQGVSSSKIVVGDFSSGDNFYIKGTVEVYAFKYTDLMNDIQNKFSWPDGKVLSDDYYDENYDELYD